MDEAVSVEVLGATEYTEEDILCGDLNWLSVKGGEVGVYLVLWRTYMGDDHGSNNKAGKSKAIADLLHD